MSTKVKGVLTRSHQMEISYATLLASSLLSPLAWLTFSKLLELMPNGKGWGYDICLGTHLASGVDTSQHGGRARHRVATGSAKAKARRAPCARSVHSQQPSTQQLWRWAGIIVHTDTRVSDLNKQTSF